MNGIRIETAYENCFSVFSLLGPCYTLHRLYKTFRVLAESSVYNYL